jgi:hypothetical protein
MDIRLILFGLLTVVLFSSMWRHRGRWIDLVPIVNDLVAPPSRRGLHQPAVAASAVMSIEQWQAIRRRQIRGRRLAGHAVKTENQKLKTEIAALQNQSAPSKRTITDGQKQGIRQFLERETAKKPLTRTGVTLLLGMDKTAGLNAIAAIEAEIEHEHRIATPLPAELATPAPLPTADTTSRQVKTA